MVEPFLKPVHSALKGRSYSKLDKMNKNLLILGVILIVVGAAAAGYFISIGESGRLRTYGSEGVAVLGVLLAIGGFMMKRSSAVTTQQFSCSKCGATFNSDMALKSHMKDKHGM